MRPFYRVTMLIERNRKLNWNIEVFAPGQYS